MHKILKSLTVTSSLEKLPPHVVKIGKNPVKHYFAPKRARPEGWRSSIPVPIDEDIRILGTANPLYWTHLRQDAKLLTDHLNRERRAELNKKLGIEDAKPQTLPQLLRWWETKSEH